MAKKQTPAWQLMGLDGPPPVVRGYHDYGTVWSADWPRPRFHWLREVAREAYWGLWSWHYWGKKVRRSWKYSVIDAWALWVHGTPRPPVHSPVVVKKRSRR